MMLENKKDWEKKQLCCLYFISILYYIVFFVQNQLFDGCSPKIYLRKIYVGGKVGALSINEFGRRVEQLALGAYR